MPATVTYFTMYEQIKVLLAARLGLEAGTGGPAAGVSLTAGALARLVAVTIVSPLELVRTKMQSQKMPLHQVKLGLLLHHDSRGFDSHSAICIY